MPHDIIENPDRTTSYVVRVNTFAVELKAELDRTVTASVDSGDSDPQKVTTQLRVVDLDNYGKFFLEGIEAVLINVSEIRGSALSSKDLLDSLGIAQLATTSIIYLDVIAGYAEVLEDSALNMLDDTVAKGLAIEVAGAGLSGGFVSEHAQATARLHRVYDEIGRLLELLEDPSEIARIRVTALNEIKAYESAPTLES
jgi:hypothetical protein